MSLTNTVKIGGQTLFGEVDEVATIEPSAEEAEAMPLTITNVAESSDWTYNASTEDNGTVGILDDEAGILYNGPSGNFVRVSVDAMVLLDSAGTETTDLASLTVFLNSTAVAYSDEGFAEHFGEITVSHNIDTIVGPIAEDDVLRIGISFTGEETEADLDAVVSSFTIV